MKTALTSIALAGMMGWAGAASISINFSQNSSNQGFNGGENIGPLATDSSNWNNTNGQPDLSTGTLNNLIDDSGANTGASMDWDSNNAYWNLVGNTSNDQNKLAVGYLDDGGVGISVTVSNIPYSVYRVIGLYSSDQANDANPDFAQDMNVNGTWVFGGGSSQSVEAYASLAANFSANGTDWSPLSTTEVGNYWSFDTSGNTLTITQSPTSDQGRAALAGIIIQEIPEPSSTALLGLAGLGFILRRRK